MMSYACQTWRLIFVKSGGVYFQPTPHFFDMIFTMRRVKQTGRRSTSALFGIEQWRLASRRLWSSRAWRSALCTLDGLIATSGPTRARAYLG
jgi:hypothetical protein